MKYIKSFLENLSDNLLNYILDKIGKSGIDSLSNHDRKLLDNYDNKDFDVEEEIKKYQKKYKQSKEIIKHIGLSVVNHDLKKDIGRYVRYKKPRNYEEERVLSDTKLKGTIYEIVDVQRHWGHNKEGKYVPDMIGYRVAVVGYDNDFGTVMSLKQVEFVNNMTEEKAKRINTEYGEI